MDKIVEIYGLIDPITQELRYIGKSKNSKKKDLVRYNCL